MVLKLIFFSLKLISSTDVKVGNKSLKYKVDMPCVRLMKVLYVQMIE